MIKCYNGSYYGQNRQKTFSQLWDSKDAFLESYNTCGIEKTISELTATNLYYLLYAAYGNSTIRFSDINQFQYAVFSRIYMYGPTWEKRLEIQSKLRKLTEAEIMAGSKDVYNSALNPNTEPGTNTTDELDYISSQNVTKRSKSKIDAYAELMTLLKTDVTKDFIDGFKGYFKQVVQKELPLYYETEVEK